MTCRTFIASYGSCEKHACAAEAPEVYQMYQKYQKCAWGTRLALASRGREWPYTARAMAARWPVEDALKRQKPAPDDAIVIRPEEKKAD
jgi:hypothetical protein